jgi:hypothetical protein
VDGIAGNQTLGKLYGASTTPTSSAPKYQVETPKMPEYNDFAHEKFSYGDINESEAVKQANDMLAQQLAQKPGDHQFSWQNQLTDVINKIMNGEKFSYDVNGDALYQQYKDQYVKQGQMAMQDAMGQAAAMTGGYGNSYAQSVGQQTYQGYLQQLTDKVPELYQLALDKHNQEKQDLLNQYSLLSDQYNTSYREHRDEVSDHYTELDYLTGRADTAWNQEAANRDFAYGLHSDEQNFKYQDHINKYENQWKQAEVDQAIKEMNTNLAYQQDRDKVADEQWQKQFDLAKNQASSSGGGSGGSGGSGGGSGSGYDNGALTTSEVKQIQAALGIPADGKWGPQSVKASGNMDAAEAYTAWKNGTLKTGGANMDTVNAFKDKLVPESRHDAIARKMYGSYSNYVEKMVESAWNAGELGDAEAEYLLRTLT